MIDFDEIEKEIINIETNRDTSYATLEKLGPLYCAMIYKRLCSNPEVYEPQPLDVSGDSDFLLAVSGKDSVRVWMIMDELMYALMVANEKVYNDIMRRIKTI